MGAERAVVLVHGAFVNSRCWDGFKARYEAAGRRVLAPDWPLLDGDPAALRDRPPEGLAAIGVDEVVDRYATVIQGLSEPPALIGHSFGGLVVQRLLDRGLGASGVAIHPAPPRGIPPAPAAVVSNFPVLWGRLLGRAVSVMSRDAFAGSFASTLPRADADAAWDRLVAPTPARPFLQAATFSSACAVDWRRADRAPLLILAGGADRSVTAGMNRANHRAYTTGRVELREFPDRDHFTIGAPGWEEVADLALSWSDAASPSP